MDLGLRVVISTAPSVGATSSDDMFSILFTVLPTSGKRSHCWQGSWGVRGQEPLNPKPFAGFGRLGSLHFAKVGSEIFMRM